MEVVQKCGVPYVGGIYVNSELKSAMSCEGTIIFEWDKVPPAVHTRVCSAIKQGFTVAYGGPVKQLLGLLEDVAGLDPIPPIGYMGKKDMHVVIPKAKGRQYQSDLVAAGHMVDVDLSNAVSIRHCDGWDNKYYWLHVSGYNVESGPRDDSPRWVKHRRGDQLKPATSKLANLVRLWQEELFPEREPLLKFVQAKKPLTFYLKSEG